MVIFLFVISIIGDTFSLEPGIEATILLFEEYFPSWFLVDR